MNINLLSQTLCETYGNMPFDITMLGASSSELDPNNYEGKHIQWYGDLYLDSDFTFKDCTIEVIDGAIIYDYFGDDDNTY